MNRRAALILMLALPLSGLAQNAKRVAAREEEPLVYEFKHLAAPAADAVTRLACDILNLRGSYNAAVRVSYFRALAYTDPGWREKALAFLQKYDVPPPTQPQVHYQAYLIRASQKATAPAGLGLSPIPKELDDAITEMKKSLVYARYDLITIVSSVSEGAASASDVMLGADEVSPHYYSIEYGDATVAPDRKSVSIRPFTFQLRGPSGDKNTVLASISSDVTVHEGQKLVIGKVRLNYDSDIFIILTVKVE